MNIPFTKVEASANDFIILDNREKKLEKKIPDFGSFARLACKRKRSVGADGLLVLWQAALSMDIFCTAAWAVSESLQDIYVGPKALYQAAPLTIFVATPLWYATAFPGWGGYRVEHDPTYTAYADVAYETPPEEKAPGFEATIVLMAIAVPTMVYFSTRKLR